MTREEALRIFYEPGRINPHIIQANDEQSQKYNDENIEAILIAVEALKEQKTGKWIPCGDCERRCKRWENLKI